MYCTESIPDQGKALEEWKSKMASDDRDACVKRVCTLAEEVKDFVKVLYQYMRTHTHTHAHTRTHTHAHFYNLVLEIGSN